MDGLLGEAILVLLAFLVVGQIALWIIQYEVVKQQGRLLVRLDELAGPSRADAVGHGSNDGHARGRDEGLPDVAAAPGLAVGATVAAFRRPELTGRSIGLDEFRGRKVLLVHWNPGCGFCRLIADDLAGLQADLERRRVQLLLVSYGTPDDNRRMADEHHLTAPILLTPEAQPPDAFARLGTPVAYLLDGEGRVAAPLAVGAPATLELARTAAAPAGKRLPGERPLSESRIEREGLKAGSRAPDFALPDARGGTVSLASYRGRRVLLVFSDPHCGPCAALMPRLGELDRAWRMSGPAVLAVSRGTLEENRRKIEQDGIQFPVALQRQWEISRAYGIFATPAGFLIDERGFTAADVAKGADAIVALARTASPATAERIG